MTAATVSRWSRAFVAVGVGWFVLAHLAILAGAARTVVVACALYGFVFHVVFGKAYALVPSYFDRELAAPRVPSIHLPIAALSTAALALAAAGTGDGRWATTVPSPEGLEAAGELGWLLGCLLFVGTLVATIADDPTGSETGTGDVNAHRKRVDRAANAFVPVVLVYLFVAALLPVLSLVGAAPSPLSAPARTHLLAAGAGALLVFTIGFRLLPRFFVATPRPALVAVVLPAGALGPALLAVDFLGGVAFHAGATLLALAVVVFAVAVGDLYRRSERRRVGFVGALAGAAAGVVAVAVGLLVAFDVGSVPPALLESHVRLALLGFLGLTIVGVSYQFYPPAIGRRRGVDDRTALASILVLAGGLLADLLGALAGLDWLATAGHAAGVAGSVAAAFVLYALFLQRRG